MIAKGELCNKFEIKGKFANHQVRQVITIEKDKPNIDFVTEIDCVDDCGRFWAKFSCDNDMAFNVGIPYGQEKRDLSLEGYEGIEQNIRGLFYYGDYISTKNSQNRFTIYNHNLCNGAKFEDGGIYLFLRRMFGSGYRNDSGVIAWYNQCDKFNKATGLMSYEYSITPFESEENLSRIAKDNLIKPDSVKKYNLTGNLQPNNSIIDIKTKNTCLASFRKVGSGYELRVFETDNKQSNLEIEHKFDDQLSVDLSGNIIEESADKISHYQINTLILK
jgi:hypothetical protein